MQSDYRTLNENAHLRGPKITAAQVVRNFVLMSVCFSFNHGCVTSLLGLASSTLSDRLSGLQSGILYIFYLLSALFCSSSLVGVFGSKGALVSGVFLYCFYVCCFLVSNIDDTYVTWISAITGAAIGGFAAGNLWTAQGTFFGETVKVYVQISGENSKEVTTRFSGYFAFIYLSLEVICKLLSSFLYLFSGDGLVYTVYAIIAVLSTIGMLFVVDMKQYVNNYKSTPQKLCSSDKVSGVLKLLFTDGRMIFLYPCIMAFGVMAGFINYYANGTIVKDSVGKIMIGYLTSTTAGVAALSSLIFPRLVNVLGKGPILVLGQLCFFTEAIIFWSISNAKLGHYTILFILYAIHGIGRSTYESTMRATFADIWKNDQQAYAFANIVVANGGSTAVAFLVFPHISKEAMCITGIVMSVLGVVFYMGVRTTIKSAGIDDEPLLEDDSTAPGIDMFNYGDELVVEKKFVLRGKGGVKRKLKVGDRLKVTEKCEVGEGAGKVTAADGSWDIPMWFYAKDHGKVRNTVVKAYEYVVVSDGKETYDVDDTLIVTKKFTLRGKGGVKQKIKVGQQLTVTSKCEVGTEAGQVTAADGSWAAPLWFYGKDHQKVENTAWKLGDVLVLTKKKVTLRSQGIAKKLTKGDTLRLLEKIDGSYMVNGAEEDWGGRCWFRSKDFKKFERYEPQEEEVEEKQIEEELEDVIVV